MTVPALDPRVLAVEQAVDLRPESLQAQVADEKLTARTEDALRDALTRALYKHFHTGLRSVSGAARPREPELERNYALRVPHRYSRVIGTAPRSSGDFRVFRLAGVDVELPARAILSSDGDRGVLSISAQRPNLSPGFFTVMGSWGWAPDSPVLRVYVNVGTAQTAVHAWGLALEYLEAAEATYHAKVVSRTNLISRRDGIVVYLGNAEYSLVTGLVQELSGLALGREISGFTKSLAPGISYAWEPSHNSPQSRLSFGQHRARAITEALFDHAENRTRPFSEHAHGRLIESRIAPTEIHRNVDSPIMEEGSETATLH
ncbi:T3SS effector HopA1 family protein [Streptomyces sp. NPDC058299]|uniref:T3SS effector HopA1 family protein n=1 Tax=Streptomyces sp. NPDC058299 TaxID=3346435 RepID=UPI0036E9BC7A